MIRPNWKQRLTRPVRVTGGPVLHTLGEASDYALALPTETKMRGEWQRVVAGLLLAADKPDEIEWATRLLELALNPE